MARPTGRAGERESLIHSPEATLRVTIVIEYPARKEHYPGCDTPEEMAAYDQASFDEGALDVVDLGEWKSVVIEAVTE